MEEQAGPQATLPLVLSQVVAWGQPKSQLVLMVEADPDLPQAQRLQQVRHGDLCPLPYPCHCSVDEVLCSVLRVNHLVGSELIGKDSLLAVVAASAFPRPAAAAE